MFDDSLWFLPLDTPNNRGTSKNSKKFYRLFVIGKKSLPEIRTSEARASERLGSSRSIFEDVDGGPNELYSDEFREGDAARPVGAGKYVIVRHQKHTEMAYILETPNQPGNAQEELGIEKEARLYNFCHKSQKPCTEGFPSAEENPKYPDKVLKELSESENFVSMLKDTRLIDFPNAQVILIGAREGKDVIKQDLGIDINLDNDIKKKKDSDVLNKLETWFKNVPTKPLIEGKME